MANDGMNAGDEVNVREEAAGSPRRGTIWALISVGAFVVILALMFFFFLGKSATDGKPNETPAQMEQRRQ
ncbi:MAG: hypothetical protein LC768_11270 [Acidobacteria bacterium]|nr:hypothetical protein [Acidobacteriota bacterium]MCA1638892.1 hypothetical protein [Acidobacteriota bacterium]